MRKKTELANQTPGFKEDAVNFVTNTMWNNIRLPFSNNWRVGSIKADCYPCTVPASSGKYVTRIQNNLFFNLSFFSATGLSWPRPLLRRAPVSLGGIWSGT